MTTNDTMRRIDGGCHCGNIRFAFHLPKTDGPIPARVCTCSFCVKHGGAYTSHPEGRIDLSIRDGADLQIYTFGSNTADFHLCRRCGVFPVVISEIDGIAYAVVNINCFEGIDSDAFNRSPISFDGEPTVDRLERRKRNWIPNVRIEVEGGRA